MTRAMLAAALLAAAPWAAADEVLLKGGGRIVGEVIDRNPREVTVDVGPGTVKLPMARVDRIVGSTSRLSEYRSRVARLNPSDVQGWLALAAWADQNDLRTQAREAWERVLTIQPDNRVAQQALGNVFHAGRWMEHDDAMRARGLVEFEGEWMNPGEREARLQVRAAQAVAERETAIADARVAEAEARAREAEARAHAAEMDAARAAEYSDGGIPLDYVYGAAGYGYGYGVGVVGNPYVTTPPPPRQVGGGHHGGRHDGGGRRDDDRRRYDPPVQPRPQPTPPPAGAAPAPKAVGPRN
ncbi:MAG TPA: hypothetical protein VFQ51_20760 [Vicinamibacteria bacterium]|nr:hypothetical protein [Vicinamibacteria bacterium]